MIDGVKNTIARFPAGYVFTTHDFSVSDEKPKAVNKVLNNLVKKGSLRRLSKGRFYKPQIGKFGELMPDTYQIVKDLIEKNGKLIGYTTGYSVFNELALTTQMPVELQIGTSKEKKKIVRGIYRISFVKQKNTITKENIPLLRLLDCLRFFKLIPDTTPDKACRRLLYLFNQLNAEQIVTIKKLVLKYNPSTIAFLGAILQTNHLEEDCIALKKAINPITVYKLGISIEVLPTQHQWNIQ